MWSAFWGVQLWLPPLIGDRERGMWDLHISVKEVMLKRCCCHPKWLIFSLRTDQNLWQEPCVLGSATASASSSVWQCGLLWDTQALPHAAVVQWGTLPSLFPRNTPSSHDALLTPLFVHSLFFQGKLALEVLMPLSSRWHDFRQPHCTYSWSP